MEVYLDDDIDDDHLIALARREQHRLTSPRVIGRRGAHDAVHLREAIQRQLPLVTRNYKDFSHLHDLVIASGGRHFGVVLVRKDNDPNRDMKHAQIVRALTNLERAMPNLHDQFVVLNQWR